MRAMSSSTWYNGIVLSNQQQGRWNIFHFIFTDAQAGKSFLVARKLQLSWGGEGHTGVSGSV